MTGKDAVERSGATDEVPTGDTADVYFERAQAILRAEHLDPVALFGLRPV
jgi:hypothetical protein